MKKNQIVYIALVGLLGAFLLLDLIPMLHPYFGWVTPPVALFIGIVFAVTQAPAFPSFNKKSSKFLLQYSVVGLGFGMNIVDSLKSGSEGMGLTVVSVIGTLAIGWFIGRKIFHVGTKTSYLISSGTAICGGSAIAAVGPVLDAREEDMSMALGTIFILNAIALFIFPVIGHLLGMSQHAFGTWAAIAIHDTSSVVGAGAAYGSEALKVATTVKLTRALWIIPVSFFTMAVFRHPGKKVKLPYFIFFFVGAMIFNTYFLADYAPAVGQAISALGHKGLTLSLFFIGASLTPKLIKSVGVKAMLQGVLLWIIISVSSLAYILYYL